MPDDGSGKSIEFSDDDCPAYGKNYTALKNEGFLDSNDRLVAKYDAAAVLLADCVLPAPENLLDWQTKDSV